MIYRAEVRCACKPNGLQQHSGRRADYDKRRHALQDALLRAYGRPARTFDTAPLLLRVTVWLRTEQAGDATGYIAGLEDTISVGKGATRLHIAYHVWPLVRDDSLIRAFAPAPGQTLCLIPGAGYDAVEFGVEPCT